MLKDRLRHLLRISSFRLAAQSAVLSVLGALLVFAIIYHASQGAIRAELDNTVASEQADVVSDTVDDKKSIVRSVADAAAGSGGTFYALTDPQGGPLAGNFEVDTATAAAWHGYRTLNRRQGLALPAHVLAIRGLAATLPNGDRLYVAENAGALLALYHLIARAFLGVFGIILGLGIMNGVLVAKSTLRRIEAITNASREIMTGDLSRRIDVNGTGNELDRLSDSLNIMLERIQALMENMRQVTNDIAHDLRSPLGRLREHLELTRINATDDTSGRALDEAIIQVDAALGIFAAMLRIAEVEAGTRRSRFGGVNLSGLLSDLADTFETVAESDNKTIHAAIDAGIEIIGDKELLTQMFVNIIENAIRYSPAHGTISIMCKHGSAANLHVVISDNGPGIPAHERLAVLQRFVRLDSARQGPGTGLGLALAAAVAELHGGSIALEDNLPGLKVVFEVRPAAASPVC